MKTKLQRIEQNLIRHLRLKPSSTIGEIVWNYSNKSYKNVTMGDVRAALNDLVEAGRVELSPDGTVKLRPRSSKEEQAPSKRKVTGSIPVEGTKHTVVCQSWIEKERGWGNRPDGASLHLNLKDCQAYIKRYWESMPDEVPDEYSSPFGDSKLIDVDAERYARIKSSNEKGIRIWESDYNELQERQ